MKVKIYLPAPENSRFTPDAFKKNIGKHTVIKVDEEDIVGVVAAAEVVPEGHGVYVTIDTGVRDFTNAFIRP
jgi:hypothetical protein